MFLSPLSGWAAAAFPHVLELSGYPPVPNPILESQEPQSFCSLLVMPILAFECILLLHITLNPSLLQLFCKEACKPISVFHLLRPSKVARYCPSAISEYRELACLSMTMKLICCPILKPTQILEKDVFQYVGNLVSSELNPVSPPKRLYSLVSPKYSEL